ncbi:serine hydrolase [Aliiroseovarius sp.]|uniref:serine hydrolase n=1 Tax=Aliiroseovarius sp. TaxID=1872442 RepID=UPI003BA87614
MQRLGQYARFGLFLMVLGVGVMLTQTAALAAPYAAMVIDARSGKVLHSRNADTQLHPASLTKMMTLYIAFEAVENGEISLDTLVTVSAKAAAEPPSKLGLRRGQKIKLRYLLRAAAIKSANDAATAIGEAISGSEAAFARRMNRTAGAMGMTRTHFKNAHGLTESGHLSTARDMTTLGRQLFYDYPQYYNLFSRLTANAGVKRVAHTNTRFLNSYRGADGIKTGYTRAAGYNLVASAERGSERIITTVFGGRSVASRNAKVAELMDLGFRRAPTRVALRRPSRPAYQGAGGSGPGETPPGKTIRVVVAPATSPRPIRRPVAEDVPDTLIAELETSVAEALEEASQAAEPVAEITAEEPPADTRVAEAEIITATASAPLTTPAPQPRPATITLTALATPAPEEAEPEVVTRMSTSGGRHWGVNVGVMTTRHQAERLLLKTALNELGTLDEALRKVVKRPDGWHANFVGLSEEGAELACRRLEARSASCKVIGPS